jgi:hypothetical protein
MTTPFQDALAALATLEVAGVVHNFAAGAIPDALALQHLPALLVLPTERERRPFSQQNDGLSALAFAGAGASLTISVTHQLLAGSDGRGFGLRTHLPRTAALIDAYFAALRADLTLGGALSKPPRVQVDAGSTLWEGGRYFGVAFRHLWTLRLS